MKKGVFATIIVSIFAVQFLWAQVLVATTYVDPQTMRTWNNSTSAYLDSVLTNQINSQYFSRMVFSQMVFNQMMMDNLKTKFGKERIAKGNASTAFTPNAKDSIIEKSAQNITEADEKAKFIAANKQLLETFQKSLKQNGLTQNDLADARALAFVIAFQVFANDDPGKARLNSLRKTWRSEMLSNVKFQGTPDDEKQAEYEQIGIQSVLATYASEIAKGKKLETNERNRADQNAKKIAESILTKLWRKPAGTIELTETGFGNKVDRIAKSGGGTVTFARVNGILTPTRDQSEEKVIAKYVERFDVEVKKRGGETNDIAFANAVAFDFAFGVQNDGKFLTPQQLKWIHDEVANDITKKEKAAYFQGLTDGDRQKYYEKVATVTMKMVDSYNELLKKMNDQSGDSFARLTRAYETKVPFQNLRSDAYALMLNILSPRKLEDYELTAEGYRKIR